MLKSKADGIPSANDLQQTINRLLKKKAVFACKKNLKNYNPLIYCLQNKNMYTISSFFSLFPIGGQALIQPHALRFHLYLGFISICVGAAFLQKKEKIRLLWTIILSQIVLWI